MFLLLTRYHYWLDNINHYVHVLPAQGRDHREDRRPSDSRRTSRGPGEVIFVVERKPIAKAKVIKCYMLIFMVDNYG